MSSSVKVMDDRSILSGQMICTNALRLMTESNQAWFHFHLESRLHFNPPRDFFQFILPQATVLHASVWSSASEWNCLNMKISLLFKFVIYIWFLGAKNLTSTWYPRQDGLFSDDTDVCVFQSCFTETVTAAWQCVRAVKQSWWIDFASH